MDNYPIDPETGLIQIPRTTFEDRILTAGGIWIPTLREVTMLVATVQVKKKVREQGGDNRGPEVEAYLAETDMAPGNPWCAAACNWCARHAANLLHLKSPLEDVPLQAYVQSYVDHGRKRGWVVPAEHAQWGDLFCLYYKSLGRYGHIGFVDSLDLAAGDFDTLEGNTGSGGTRDGDGFYDRTRRITSNVLFLRWTD